MVGQGWTLVAASDDQGATASCVAQDGVEFPASSEGVRLDDMPPLLEVRAASDASEILIPFAKAYLKSLDLPAKKIGSGDELWQDHVLAGLRGTRTPMYWTLDEKTRVAGCHMIREAVERVILEEGIDTYKGFVREVIEDGRRSFKARLKEMTIPGRYRAPAFIELDIRLSMSTSWTLSCFRRRPVRNFT